MVLFNTRPAPVSQTFLPFFPHAPSIDTSILPAWTLIYPKVIYCACRLFGTTLSYPSPESLMTGHTGTVLCFFVLPPFLTGPLLRTAFITLLLVFQRMFVPLVAGAVLDPAISIPDHTVNVVQAKFPRSVWEHVPCAYLRGGCGEPSQIGVMVHNTVLFKFKFIVLIIFFATYGIIQRYAYPARMCRSIYDKSVRMLSGRLMDASWQYWASTPGCWNGSTRAEGYARALITILCRL